MNTIAIDIVEAEDVYGVITKHERMENGELRFRLMHSDGSGYARTESRNGSGWQNSHYHIGAKEIYSVQKGWMAFAEYIDHKVCIQIIRPGDFIMSNPGVVHNVYLAADSVIHTVKFGETKDGDWHAFLEFDQVTKNLNEESIFRKAKK
jgi:hypothetical protein